MSISVRPVGSTTVNILTALKISATQAGTAHNGPQLGPVRFQEEPADGALDGTGGFDGIQGLDRPDEGFALLQDAVGSVHSHPVLSATLLCLAIRGKD